MSSNGWTELIEQAQREVLEHGVENVDEKTVLLATFGRTSHILGRVEEKMEDLNQNMNLVISTGKRVFVPLAFLVLAILGNLAAAIYRLMFVG